MTTAELSKPDLTIPGWEEAIHLHRSWLEREAGGVRMDWTGREVEGCAVRSARLERAILANVKLRDVDAAETCFAGADLSDGVWQGVTAKAADFTGADMTRLRVEGMQAAGCCLHEARLIESLFVDSCLDATRWLEAVLDGARFERSTVRNGVFHQARLTGCDFTGCDLTGVNLSYARVQLSKFTAAVLRQTKISNARCPDNNFSRADLEGSVLSRTDWSRCTFTAARLERCDLRGAVLAGASLFDAVLEGAALRDAELTAADLRGANLRGARELTSRQLAQARTDEATVLPNGSPGPYRPHSGAERPVRI